MAEVEGCGGGYGFFGRRSEILFFILVFLCLFWSPFCCGKGIY